MKTKTPSFYIIGFGILMSSLIVGAALARHAEASGEARAQAQAPAAPSDAGINYPIGALGNCKDKEACKAYCDNPAHLDACIAFGEKNNLMSKDEADIAKKFSEAGGKGPGGCTGRDSCETYCNDAGHINECVAFAEKAGILPPDQLAEAKQVQAAIARGVAPPPCKNKKECDAYCENPGNMKVCVAFGEAAGFLKGKELEDAKKIMAAMDKGATPPPCKGKDACDVYCSDPAHIETCMTFAQAAGLMSPEEAQNSQKVIEAVKKGVKPPACRGKDKCDKYCSEPAHMDECVNFSVAAGFMSEKDAEVAKKTGGRGPGGCKSKDECDAFCNNQDNQQTCFNFGRDNGLIPPEELQKMQEGQKKFQESFQNMPQQVLTCLQSSIGGDGLEKFKSGQAMPSRDIGEKMGQCFSQMGVPGRGMGPGGPGAGGSMQPGRQGPQGNFQNGPIGPRSFPGPGGCKTLEECKKFCDDNLDVCKNFGPQMQPGTSPNGEPGQQGNFQQGQGGPGGGPAGSFVGPGGCKTPEECKTFCGSNPESCKNFRPPVARPGMTPPAGKGQPGEMQPNMPQQGMGLPGEGPEGTIPPKEGMPIQGGLPLNGTMPPTGGTSPFPGGTPPPTGSPPPGAYNPPSIGQFLLGMLVGVFAPQ